MGGSSEGAHARRGEAPLRRLLEGVLANLDLRGQFREHLAVLAWPGVAGKVVAAHAQAEGVRDGVLMVATDTPAWAQELQMRRRALLERLAAEVGPGVIREIHFRAGLRRRRGKPPASAPRPGEVKLSGRQERRARAAAAPLARTPARRDAGGLGGGAATGRESKSEGPGATEASETSADALLGVPAEDRGGHCEARR